MADKYTGCTFPSIANYTCIMVNIQRTITNRREPDTSLELMEELKGISDIIYLFIWHTKQVTALQEKEHNIMINYITKQL